MPTLGVIGCGSISRFHFRAFAETQTPIAVVSDLRLDAARAQAVPFGAEATTDWHAVINHPRVEAVAVLTPSPVHAEVVRAALEAGKHVVCEKALTLCGADSLALGRLAMARKRVLFTSWMKRFFPAVERARELVPRLGRILSIHIRTHQLAPSDLLGGNIHPFFAPAPGSGPSAIRVLSGGGALVCSGSHMLDLLIDLVGAPDTAYGRSRNEPGADVEFMFHGLMGYASGAVAHLDCLWHRHRGVGFEGRGWDETLEIIGTRGRLVLSFPVWDQPERAAARLAWYDETTRAWSHPAFDSPCPFGLAERHFLAQFSAGEQGARLDVFAGYRVDALIDALTRSAAGAGEISLTWEDA